MTRRTIGGHLDVDALAKLYRPADPPTLRAAAVEMARSGLTARDIASSLGLTEAAVRQLLAWEEAG
jgi:DNA-binding NarL/FixJ family response regulator